ncbi:ATP-binding protein [Sorangium sp. So ce260]|uniref:AlbA family DNA-binding domain-containing protein n=1 Tax=Sorangium sp. So ce260 TaxID=3133291 RepID=UPI003F62C171
MDNAESLFRKLDLAYVQQEMVGKEFENNWLECKEKQKPEQGALDQGDKSSFAKALSGFANTSGGVLIFGLEARKDKDEVDMIIGLKPIKELRKFESALREMESRIVERVVVGVEYLRITTKEDEGLLAVYVPPSEYTPHRNQMDSKFYLRAGGVFNSMPVSLIEDLFARRLRPELEFIIRRLSDEQLLVALKNSGRASAKTPYVVFALPDDFRPSGCDLSGNTPLNPWTVISNYKGTNGPYIAFTGNNLIIHPESEVSLLRLEHPRVERTGYGRTVTWSLDYHVYAEHMRPVEGQVEVKIEA